MEFEKVYMIAEVNLGERFFLVEEIQFYLRKYLAIMPEAIYPPTFV